MRRGDAKRPVHHPVRSARGELEHLVDIAEHGESSVTPALVIAGVALIVIPLVVLVIAVAMTVEYLS